MFVSYEDEHRTYAGIVGVRLILGNFVGGGLMVSALETLSSLYHYKLSASGSPPEVEFDENINVVR